MPLSPNPSQQSSSWLCYFQCTASPHTLIRHPLQLPSPPHPMVQSSSNTCKALPAPSSPSPTPSIHHHPLPSSPSITLHFCFRIRMFLSMCVPHHRVLQPLTKDWFVTKNARLITPMTYHDNRTRRGSLQCSQVQAAPCTLMNDGMRISLGHGGSDRKRGRHNPLYPLDNDRRPTIIVDLDDGYDMTLHHRQFLRPLRFERMGHPRLRPRYRARALH